MKRVLVANRGEIAGRIIKACRACDVESVAVYSQADQASSHTWEADRAVRIGHAAAGDSYLRADRLLHVALATGCDGLHPGYGFLSERADFIEQCSAEGIVFIGPAAEHIRLMGDKAEARRTVSALGVPVVPGSADSFADAGRAHAEAAAIGYPMLLKARSGGGGRGMRVVEEAGRFHAQFTQARVEAEAAFGDGEIYLERYFQRIRHIEVQVFGDRHGQVRHLGERDCTLQRRHQKLLEESPSPALDQVTRERICQAAVTIAKGIDYEGAGTVEFIYDADSGEFFFIEMNTRIQVEHPVTEVVTGCDLVAEQIRVAAGQPLSFADQQPPGAGHAIEFRINAEDPARGFMPSPGVLRRWQPPQGEGIRFDSHVYQGYAVPPYYDSLLGKLIVHGHDRAAALARARDALQAFVVDGVATTIPFHLRVLEHPDFIANRVHTRWVETELN
jgi:acetyl-CoA carboxylase biotin carboxylase subunit